MEYIPNRYSHIDKFLMILSYTIMVLLNNLNIDPSIITLCGVMIKGASTFVCFQNRFRLFMVFQFIHHYIDDLDGTYARFSKRSSDRGGWLDALSDRISGIISWTTFVLMVHIYLLKKNEVKQLVVLNLLLVIFNLLSSTFWNKYDPTLFNYIVIFLFLNKYKIGTF